MSATTSLKELPGVLGVLGQEIVSVVQREAASLRSELETKYKDELETKNKEHAAWELVLLRNSEALQLQIRDLKLKQEKEVAELRADFARRINHMKEAHAAELAEQKAENDKLRVTVERQTETLGSQAEELTTSSVRITDLELSCGNFRKKSISLEIENLGMRAKLGSLREELEICQSKISALTGSERQMSEKLRIATAEIDRLRSEISRMSLKLGQYLVENETLKKEISDLHRRLESQNLDLQRELRILGERNRELNFRLTQAAQWGAQVSRDLEILRKNFQNPDMVKTQTDTLLGVIKNLLQSLQSQETEISSLARKNADLLDQLDATERELKLERQLLPVMHSPVLFM